MSNYNDGNIIDVRGVMGRVEELESERDQWEIECPHCGGTGAKRLRVADLADPALAVDNRPQCETCEGAGQVSAIPESIDAWQNEPNNEDDAAELVQLTELLSDLADNGGDEQWRGEWYPLTLVADHYFTQHAEEEAESCGLINAEAHWPNNCIDWEEAARQLKQDYSSITFDGGDWWYR